MKARDSAWAAAALAVGAGVGMLAEHRLVRRPMRGAGPSDAPELPRLTGVRVDTVTGTDGVAAGRLRGRCRRCRDDRRLRPRLHLHRRELGGAGPGRRRCWLPRGALRPARTRCLRGRTRRRRHDRAAGSRSVRDPAAEGARGPDRAGGPQHGRHDDHGARRAGARAVRQPGRRGRLRRHQQCRDGAGDPRPAGGPGVAGGQAAAARRAGGAVEPARRTFPGGRLRLRPGVERPGRLRGRHAAGGACGHGADASADDPGDDGGVPADVRHARPHRGAFGAASRSRC